jgi:hypothetical protein
MKKQASSSEALRKRRHQLVRDLPPIEQIVRGSLMETYKRCGRPNCHCVDGPGHGYAQVAEFLANFRKLQEMLNEICAINAELLRRRERLD